VNRKSLAATSVAALMFLFLVLVTQGVKAQESINPAPVPSGTPEMVEPMETPQEFNTVPLPPDNSADLPKQTETPVPPTVNPATPDPDPQVFSMPYEEYDLTAGIHGMEYGHMAVDIAAGAGTEVRSSIDGKVTKVGTELAGPYSNTVLVIENEFYSVLYYHGDYNVVEGQEVARGEVVGKESNHGYTKCEGGLVPGEDYGCGYHTHLNVFDKTLGRNVDPTAISSEPVNTISRQALREPEPRVARGNFVRDWQQPLAPFWQTQAPTIWWWRGNIYQWAQQHKVNPNTIAVILQIESCGWPNAGSDAGAQGLFQVMPLHFAAGATIENMRDIETNAQKGVGYFSYMLERTSDDAKKSFAGYNFGPRALSWDQSTWPAETQRYIRYAVPILEDAYAAAEDSETLRAFRQLYGADLCAAAQAWQDAHPEASRSPGGTVDVSTTRVFTRSSGKINIDMPPVLWLVMLGIFCLGFYYVLGWQKTGKRVWKAAMILVVLVWFPLNFWNLPKAINVGIYPYTNIAFEIRQWLEEKGKVLDDLSAVTEAILELPIPEVVKAQLLGVTGPIAQAKDTKDDLLAVFSWLGDDPVLTPAFRFFSDVLQHYTVRGVREPELLLVQNHAFVSTFPAEENLIFLRVVAANPWGLHGDSCYTCLGLKSWIGTDILIPPDTAVYSPINGIVEDVTLGGEYDQMGASVWISNDSERFAVAGLSLIDIQNWRKGDEITAGQRLGVRAVDQEFLHLILQLRNEDGTWGDYPVGLLLSSVGVEFGWFDTDPAIDDSYVPTTDEIINQADLINKESVIDEN